MTDFRKLCEAHKDEIEALKVLYSRPYRSGLRFKQVKELVAALKMTDKQAFDRQRLWAAFELVEPQKVKARGGKPLVDALALVRHAIDPEADLVPVGLTVQARYEAWLKDGAAAGVTFTAEQRQWLDAIRDHIATSLRVPPSSHTSSSLTLPEAECSRSHPRASEFTI